MKRSTILIILASAILILAGITSYSLFFSGENASGDSILSSLFPGASDRGEVPPSAENETFNGSDTSNPLWQISEKPVSGAAAFDDEVLFIEKETGHVLQAFLASRETTRITNTTIPAIQEVVWSAEGDELILRYVDETNVEESPQSFYAKIIPGETGEGALEGKFLDADILSISPQDHDAKVFYIQETGGEASGVIAHFDGTNKRQIFSSPITEWLADWNSTGSIVLATKPSAEAAGFAYLLSQNGALLPLAQNIRGLTVNVNADRTHMLWSEGRDNAVFLQVYNLENDESLEVGIHTLPEKCAWAGTVAYCGVPEQIPAAKYPDAWYQGTVSFSDSVWRIDTEFGTADRIYNPRGAGIELDIIEPRVSEGGDYLVFTNKKDSTLWSLDLSAVE